jgi:hypothetical protein
MTEHSPAVLMPRWWQLSSTAVLYAAYGLWLVPFGRYFWGGADLLSAGLWLVGVLIAQFILAKLIALIEFMATAKKIEDLRAAEDALAHTGDKN